ncbi:hypothetical protein [Acetivibrio cellulolyticus]|uniref:hypothetical protein n=1 Tax=Acetivibrio cellulolyticus TaxID=35830 RepID=UPI0001E2E71B|nr:hypothetical protein [Acetivibrio cellulolyticus]
MNYPKKVEWSRLDNASKIFPATCSYRDPKVFRLACELVEDVEPKILQLALNAAIKRFPLYKSVLRRGVFWYYFETSDIQPVVEKETNHVCAPIYRKYERNLLFRVFYYKKRINIEVFHALSDGTGALSFMKTLVYHYLLIKHKDEFACKVPELNYSASVSEKNDDSFIRHYPGWDFRKQMVYGIKREKVVKAYRIRGTRLEENRVKVIEGAMSAKAVLEEAHKYNTTLTIFLSALLISSIYQDMPARKKRYPVVLSVPINLRQFFKSETARNFFSTMSIEYHLGKNNLELSEVIKSLSESFQRKLTEESLNQHLNWLIALERNPFARIIPLPLKNYSLRTANIVMDMGVTAAISNVGKVSMPSEFEGYINQFSVIPNVKRPQMTICTYGDRLVVTFASPFRETELQKTFFESLTNMGIKIEISSNI